MQVHSGPSRGAGLGWGWGTGCGRGDQQKPWHSALRQSGEEGWGWQPLRGGPFFSHLPSGCGMPGPESLVGSGPLWDLEKDDAHEW